MFPSKHFFLSTVIRVAAPLLFAVPTASIFLLKSKFVFAVDSITLSLFGTYIQKVFLKTEPELFSLP